MHRGYIKIWRKVEEWEWYKCSNTLHLLIHLVLKANHKPYKFMGQIIERGQVVVGRKSLSAQTGISERSIRTSITRLKSTSEIVTKTTNRFTVISILNYEIYQDKTTNETTSKSPSDRPANDHNQRIIKNEKNKTSNKRTLLTDEAFINQLRGDEFFRGVDIDGELAKIDRWLARNPHRKKTRRFVQNWLERADKVMEAKPKEDIWQKAKSI